MAVWQIAQRDYKFGKGKHSSLTKATYDAIGNRFRGLWGKEAGWAHSVLFTADLRAFSERLVVKTEVEEVEMVKAEVDEHMKKTIKMEVDDDKENIITTTTAVKEEKRKVKREVDEAVEHKLDDAQEDMATLVKRRRRRKA